MATPDSTPISDPEAIVAAMERGARLTGLAMGASRIRSLRGARLEQPYVEVDDDATEIVLLDPAVVIQPTRGERRIFVHRNPLPAGVADGTSAGDGQVGAVPAIASSASGADTPSAMPDLDREPERLWAGIVDVTIEIAEAWLRRNTDNRPRRSSAVSRYKGLMAKDRWMVSTDAIGFDATGKMVNGQHRAEGFVRFARAVVDAGSEAPTLPMLVVTGLDPSVFAVLDGGTPRTGSDVLSIRGFEHANVVAALVRAVLFAEAGTLWTRGRSSPLELDELVRAAEARKGAFVSAARSGQQLANASRGAGKVMVPSLAAITVFAYRKAGQGDAVESYLHAVATGIGIAATDDPAHVVRQAYLDDQRADVRMGRAERLAILIRGAQHVVAGKPMLRARGKGAGAWPSPSVPGWPKQKNPVAVRAAKVGTIDDPVVMDLDEDDDA